MEIFSRLQHFTMLSATMSLTISVSLQKTAAMEEVPYKYLVYFHRNGKVVEQEFCNTEDEVKVLQAIAHSKGCRCETMHLHEDKPKAKDPVQPLKAPKTSERQTTWERRCKCIETGKVYPSVRECSRDTGITYRAIINALRCGSARNGLHFTSSINEPTPTCMTKKMRKYKEQSCIKYVCTTTREVFDSFRDILTKYDIPQTSFYRALDLGKPIKGLMFKKA